MVQPLFSDMAFMIGPVLEQRSTAYAWDYAQFEGLTIKCMT